MHTEMVLHVIAPALAIVGMIFLMPRFFRERRLFPMLSWFCIVAGLIIQIVSLYLKGGVACVLCVLAPALLILGLLLIVDKFFIETSLFVKLAWHCLMAGFILIIVALYVPVSAVTVLHSVAYPILTLGVVAGVLKYINGEGCVFMYLFSWSCVIAALVLEIIAVHL